MVPEFKKIIMVEKIIPLSYIIIKYFYGFVKASFKHIAFSVSLSYILKAFSPFSFSSFDTTIAISLQNFFSNTHIKLFHSPECNYIFVNVSFLRIMLLFCTVILYLK